MENKQAYKLLCVFANKRRILKSVFMRQSGCSNEELLLLLNEGYLTEGKTDDGDQVLYLTSKGKEVLM